MNPFAFLSPYKTLIEALIIGSIICSIGYAIHHFIQYERNIQHQIDVAEYEIKFQQATEAARKQEDLLRTQIQEAQDAAAKRDQTIRTLAAAAGTASNSLRDTLNNISRGVPSASLDALRNTTAVLARVFGECQDRYRSVAEVADRANSDKKTLIDSWPK